MSQVFAALGSKQAQSQADVPFVFNPAAPEFIPVSDTFIASRHIEEKDLCSIVGPALPDDEEEDRNAYFEEFGEMMREPSSSSCHARVSFNDAAVIHKAPTSLVPPVPALTPSSSSSMPLAAEVKNTKKIKRIVMKNYAEHNPSKLCDVDRLMRKYHGREFEFLERICGKYTG